jgi:MerR family transcriptional regulator/heat shock protein HspR
MSEPTELSDRPVFVISVAAELAGMHPQTLRAYDRLGLVRPGRASGRGRRYSERDVALLRQVARLSQEEGVSLNGVRRILELQQQVDALQQAVRELACALEEQRVLSERAVADAHATHRRELVPVSRDAGSVVLYAHGRRRS